jgi:hypothetical protein
MFRRTVREQIGQAWDRGFATENAQLCSECQPTNGETLGVSCSIHTLVFLMAINLDWGRQVNASGIFLVPFTAAGFRRTQSTPSGPTSTWMPR